MDTQAELLIYPQRDIFVFNQLSFPLTSRLFTGKFAHPFAVTFLDCNSCRIKWTKTKKPSGRRALQVQVLNIRQDLSSRRGDLGEGLKHWTTYQSNKKNLDINLRDMRKKKYAHITHKSLTITNVEGNGVGGRSMLRRQSGSTLVTSFCYCFQCGSRASLHGCVCVCELDVWSCARLGSCQKSTQTSTLRSDKNTSSHTDIHTHTHTHAYKVSLWTHVENVKK